VSAANEFEFVVRYEQRKIYSSLTTKLAKWCHRFQGCNCASFKWPLGITRRQYRISEICWILKLAHFSERVVVTQNTEPRWWAAQALHTDNADGCRHVTSAGLQFVTSREFMCCARQPTRR